MTDTPNGENDNRFHLYQVVRDQIAVRSKVVVRDVALWEVKP